MKDNDHTSIDDEKDYVVDEVEEMIEIIDHVGSFPSWVLESTDLGELLEEEKTKLNRLRGS